MALLSVITLGFVFGISSIRKQMSILGNQKVQYGEPATARPVNPNPKPEYNGNFKSEAHQTHMLATVTERLGETPRVDPPNSERILDIELSNGWKFEVNANDVFFLAGGDWKYARDVIVGDKVQLMDPTSAAPAEHIVIRIESAGERQPASN